MFVIDQFEEVFTLGPQVPGLVESSATTSATWSRTGSRPNSLPARGDEEDTADLALRSRNYKLLISLREDFLPDLESWRSSFLCSAARGSACSR